MATNAQTIDATQAMRVELDKYVGTAQHDLARQWSDAWDEIASEFEHAAKELTDLAAGGKWPTRGQVLRAQRAQNALKAAADSIGSLNKNAARVINRQLAGVTQSAGHWQQRIVKTQLPQHGIVPGFDRVSADALDSIVNRTTGRVESLLRPLSADVQRTMKSTLIRGVAVGDNPNAAARQIVRRCKGVFDGGLARATNIARTEMIDAHRDAALKTRVANKDVLSGWRWHCAVGARTCPSCLSQHGRLYPIDEPGPHDHQQGRCTAVPVTKSWRDLGIDLDEPEDDFPDAQQWFKSQSKDVQTGIMGADRLAKLNSGELQWADLSVRVKTPGWRDSYRTTPLSGVPSNAVLAKPRVVRDLPKVASKPVDPFDRWTKGRDIKINYANLDQITYNPENPLEFYGNKVTIKDKSAISGQHLADIEKFPEGEHHALRRHFAGRNGSGFHVGDAAAPDLDDLGYLRKVHPRGWAEGKTFDEVPGVYDPTKRVCACGNGRHGSKSLALHEGSHAVDAALGEISKSASWTKIAKQHEASAFPYYSQAANPTGYLSEMFAEAHGAWVEATYAGASRMDVLKQVRQALGLGPGAKVDTMVNYFERLEASAFKKASHAS